MMTGIEIEMIVATELLSTNIVVWKDLHEQKSLVCVYFFQIIHGLN